MLDADRLHLLGIYRTPRCRIGQWVRCRVRGKVQIVGLSDAPIPWPMCQAHTRRVPILYKDLEKAVRRESEQAIAHWWGVSLWAVNKWRRALGVGATTEGTSRLRRDYTQEPHFQANFEQAQESPWTDERSEKVAASRRGKSRPQHVIEAMREGRTGKPQSEESRSYGQRRRNFLSCQCERPAVNE
jgi:hypothetical protein